MTRKKKLLALSLLVIAVSFLFFTWYRLTYSMDEASSFEVNSHQLQNRLLIATQGSEFKNTITNSIVNYYKEDSIFIEVIDVTKLNKIDFDEYSAIVLIHTWENWKPPIEVETFIIKNKAYKNKIIVFTTSGNGSYQMEGVDAITGESKIENAELYSNQIIEKLNVLLKLR